MPKFLDANSTVPVTSSFAYLSPGTWKFRAEISATDAASIGIKQRYVGSTVDDDVNDSAGLVALTYNDAAVQVVSGGEEFAVIRTGGSVAVTVSAMKV